MLVRSLQHSLVAIFVSISFVVSLPNSPGHGHSSHRDTHDRRHSASKNTQTCPNPSAPGLAFTDYSVKVRSSAICAAQKPGEFLVTRDIVADDYSCSESKPCKNGACCAKSGYCGMTSSHRRFQCGADSTQGYGPESCGDGSSPNDKCWSNCDAHAECGKYAEKPGQECPLNV